MKQQIFQQQLSRRIMGEDGLWLVFCRTCGKYKPETEFYKKKKNAWGVDSRCKIHFNRKEKDEDKSNDHLKLNPLTEDDFRQTQMLLQKLGYRFDTDESIHIQFLKKHKL
jgi:hypothetical protein